MDKKIKELFANKNFVKIIMAVALLGLVCIGISEFNFPDEKKEIEPIETCDYIDVIEQKIFEVVTAITGEKSPCVMVTLKANKEYIYAKELKEEEKSIEEKYIIIRGENGEEKAVVLTELEPEVKGVVVASELAGNISARESIINAISTVLDLPSNKVCVVNKSK